MTRFVRILLLLASAGLLVAPAPAGARESAAAPLKLRAFLLRADEPVAHTFPRTPSFAWVPVREALRYEFQLSTSSSFRENGIVYSDESLTTPVASPSLTLPWITGEPHALYARVRAVTADVTTPWSASFGFDVEPSKVATPLPSHPGLIRWTPVDGATGYEVWFVDIPKIIRTTTNVADQREFYTFHQAASWLSSVRWRVRAIRLDYNSRANGLPAAMTGPWSPVYSSVNPPFATGPLKPTATVSDVVAAGAKTDPAHRLMPGFVYNGNQPASGAALELYRVQVFTDRKCVNRVWTGAIVGSPAYAPRVSGPLLLPRTSAGIADARLGYLGDGGEGATYLADGGTVVANESLPGVEPTITLPEGKRAEATAPAAPKEGAPKEGESKESSGGTKEAPKKAGTVQLLNAKGTFGPPVDIWDTDWAHGGGYYWTVIPVEARVPAAAVTSVSGASAIGATQITVGNGTLFAVGDTVAIGAGGNLETATVTAVTPTSLSFGAPLKFAHGGGESVTRTNGATEYKDAELAQDACAAGRVMRFGKESEPSLTSAGEAFATGLTPEGTMDSAEDGVPEFYGSPLVAWTPALGANVYAVQWSKTASPFRPETDPATGALGMMTVNTSVVLPLEPGTWYYRVRGYSYSLPTGSQALSWSDPQKVLVAKPTFSLVAATDSAAEKALRVPSGGFALRLPKEWNSGNAKAADSKLFPLGNGSLQLAALVGTHTALFVQSGADPDALSGSDWAKRTTAGYKSLPGRKGRASCSKVSLPAGASVRCVLSVRAGETTQVAVVYSLRHRSATYTLTFATTPASAASKRTIFQAVARSFRFTS